MLSGKYGKLKAAGFTVTAVFALWFGLAVFYKTDIGIPIGVKNYLFHKYNEEFDVDGYFGVKISGNPQNQLTCCPKNGNKATDCFNVARKNTLSIGSKRFASDNYYGIIIRDDYEKHISKYISKYFDNYEVKVKFDYSGLSNVKYMSDWLSKDTSLEEFLAFQKDEKNIRACNSSSIDIILYEQTSSEEKIIKDATSLFNDLTVEYCYMDIFIKSANNKNIIYASFFNNSEVKIYNGINLYSQEED